MNYPKVRITSEGDGFNSKCEISFDDGETWFEWPVYRAIVVIKTGEPTICTLDFDAELKAVGAMGSQTLDAVVNFLRHNGWKLIPPAKEGDGG